MTEETRHLLEERCTLLTEHEFMVHPQRNELVGQLNDAKRRHDHLAVSIIGRRMQALRDEIYKTLWKGIEDMEATVQKASDVEDQKRLNDLIGALFLLADMFESVSMDLESLTRRIVVGDYNPFAQLELRKMIDRLRTLLRRIYQDAPQAVADEFARAADRTLGMIINNARTALKKANTKDTHI